MLNRFVPLFAAKLTLLATTFLVPISNAQAFTVSLAATTPIAAGSTFDIDVVVDDIFADAPFDNSLEAVVGFGFDFDVSDSSLAAFSGATLGPGFDPTGSSSPAVNGFATSIDLSKVAGVTTLLLATLSFDALAPGLLTLSLATPSYSVPTASEGLIYALAGAGDLTTQADFDIAPQVPVPTTLLLLATGFGCIAIRRRAGR